MTTFEIIEAKAHHCGQMARLLRHEHADAVAWGPVASHRKLRECFELSSWRRAWLIDGRLAGLGGVTGTIASARGAIWLALSDGATRYPVAIVKEARRQLDEITRIKQEVVTTIVLGDAASRRLADFLGFVAIGDDLIDVGGVDAIAMAYRRIEEA